jgi:predicted nucleic-acid-binding protein
MELIDANVILRYLLKDNVEQYSKAQQIIEKQPIFVPFEVLAEVVYVLEKVYEVPAFEIRKSLNLLLNYPNIDLPDFTVAIESLKTYHEENIDFVYALLFAYKAINGYAVNTFDKKLNKLLNK